ncbi:MAG: CcmD family protein [Rhodothermales bacterium]|nr:CcmD family protein [Rhodothermales bacterium]
MTAFLQETPAPPGAGLESVMLSNDKLYVVLAVVLIIWFGLLFFLFRTDRRIARLERTLDERIDSEPPRL